MIKGIIFDMDGVLVETEKYHYQSWKKAFKTKGIHLSESDYHTRCQSQGHKTAICNMMNPVSETTIQEISFEKSKYYKDTLLANGVHLYSDAKYLLDYLKATTIQLSIASSSSIADFVISQSPYYNVFTHIITGKHITHNKPHPEIFTLARMNMGYRKHEVLVIEDSITGVIAARRAGINVLAINRDHSLDAHNLNDVIHSAKQLKINLSKDDLASINASTTYPIHLLNDVLDFIL